MRYETRPITDRTWIGTKGKIASQFKSSWGDTIALLKREVESLGASEFVIEMDISASDLKLDGELRANARPISSAVVVSFESDHGPLTYRCDRFVTNYYDQGPEWQHNVRAIARTLESLRAVDRYGATETGQQYAGFKALGAGRAMPSSHMTSNDARALLIEWAQKRDVVTVSMATEDVYKHARRAAHPDHNGGDHAAWDQVEHAGLVLGVAR